ncbi:MAG TPA: CoA ester lyase [Stellaceae bacterium]|nr:CoA ester lyase [Stellaceae bacterium]
MAAQSRPRRSVLYMPGANVRAMEKARALPADALILDLEDAVAPDAKETARANVATAIAYGGYGRRELIVRVNGIATPWFHADIQAVAKMGVDAVLLPKVESADTVRQAEALLNEAGAPSKLALWCMMETPLAMLHAEEIASSSARMGALVMGTSDLTKDLHALHTRDRLAMQTSFGLSLLAARAFGLAILDGVYLDLQDDEGFAESCRQGRLLGFDGKTLIHPKTIDAANAAFAPSTEEIEWSRRIITAHAACLASGKGVVLVDGKLIENLHVAEARRVVDLGLQIAALERAACLP